MKMARHAMSLSIVAGLGYVFEGECKTRCSAQDGSAKSERGLRVRKTGFVVEKGWVNGGTE